MNFLKNKTGLKILSVILTLGITGSAAAVISYTGMFLAVDAAAVSDANVKKYQDQLASIEAERKKTQAELNEARARTQSEAEEKAALDKLVTDTQMKIDLQNEQKDLLEQRIVDIGAQIEQTEQDIIRREELFKERLVAAHEEGTVSYLEIILGSENLIDFFSRLDTVGTMLQYDKSLIKQCKADKLSLQENRVQLEETSIEIDKRISDIKVTERELLALQEESARFLEKYQNDQAALERLAAAEAQSKNEIEAKLSQALADYKNQLAIEAERLRQAELDKQRQSVSSQSASNSAGIKQYTKASGDYIWPLSGWTTVSSGFGYRGNEYHAALDIPASYGTAISAANGGTVLIAEYHYSYGNYVLIDHGNGVSTLYAHMSSISVSVGQSVSKGATIGKVGSTGYSTGNHLHFEVRENGTKVNPSRYV